MFTLLALGEILLYKLLVSSLPFREWLINIKALFPGSWASGSLKPRGYSIKNKHEEYWCQVKRIFYLG